MLNRKIKICDEFGSVYSSENEIKKIGLVKPRYGTTYCQYFKTEPVSPEEYQKILGVGIDVD